MAKSNTDDCLCIESLCASVAWVHHHRDALSLHLFQTKFLFFLFIFFKYSPQLNAYFLLTFCTNKFPNEKRWKKTQINTANIQFLFAFKLNNFSFFLLFFLLFLHQKFSLHFHQLEFLPSVSTIHKKNYLFCSLLLCFSLFHVALLLLVLRLFFYFSPLLLSHTQHSFMFQFHGAIIRWQIRTLHITANS